MNLDSSGPGGQGNFITRNPPPQARGGAFGGPIEFSSGAPLPAGGRGHREDVRESQWGREGRNVRENDDLHEILNIPPQLRVSVPPPRPSPKKKKEGWMCPSCTYFNIPQRPGCEMCGEERPDDYDMPEGMLDDKALQLAENDRLFLEVCVCMLCVF